MASKTEGPIPWAIGGNTDAPTQVVAQFMFDADGRALRLGDPSPTADRLIDVDLTVDAAVGVVAVAVRQRWKLGPVPTTFVRSLKLGEMERAVRRRMESSRLPQARVFAGWPEGFKRPGRAGRDPIEYAEVARRYVELCGTEPKPLVALANELKLSPSQVRNLLYRARRDGLLTRAPDGRAGGELTAKGKGLLTEDGQP